MTAGDSPDAKLVRPEISLSTIGLTASTIAAECGAKSRPALAPGASAFRCDGARILVECICPRASGHFRLKSRCSGLCVDVNGAGKASGAALIRYHCGSGTSRQ